MEERIKRLELDIEEYEQENAAMRAVLQRIVDACSYTRDEHDPLVRVGLMALDGMSVTGEGWLSPKRHQAALLSLRARCGEVVHGALHPDLKRYYDAILTVPLEKP